jgi:hypothetical protein
MIGAAGLVCAAADDTFQGISVKAPFDPKNHGGSSKPAPTPVILYHGGPVMNVSNSVYVIYYGATFADTTQPIINDFLHGLKGSAPFGVNSSYNAGGTTLSIPSAYAFEANSQYIYLDKSYSQGTQLGSSSVPKIVANAIGKGLPYDANGVYFVVTAPDVKISGFCTSFCAYHNDTNVTVSGGSAHVRYALIPDPTQRCSGCNGGIAVYGDTTTPNGDMGADTMTDDIMHELSETVTDPDISAWYTQNGAENGDLCNYVYGTANSITNALGTYHYNVMLPAITGGPRPYLIQQIWKNGSVQACASN